MNKNINSIINIQVDVLMYLSSGCVQGWIIPFMSKYKLSNSTPLGFGAVVSTGISSPLSIVLFYEITNPTVTDYILQLYTMMTFDFGLTFSSMQWTITEGYFFVNHRKNAGTPIVVDSLLSKLVTCQRRIRVWKLEFCVSNRAKSLKSLELSLV